MTNNRDFIDFLMELIKRKKILFAILLVFVGYAVYFNSNKNDQYTFKTSIKISPESVFIPIINNINVYRTSANVYLNPRQSNANYAAFALDLCGLIKSSFVDEKFIMTMAENFLFNNPSSDKKIEKVFNEMKNAIERLPSDVSTCVNVKLSETADYISFLKREYPSMLNMYVQQEISKRLTLIRKGKLDYLQKTLDSTPLTPINSDRERILGQLELNTIEERRLIVVSNLDLVKNTEVADTNVQYIIWNASNVGQTLNYIFLYAFAIFLSIIFYVLTVVLIEFKEQFKRRSLKEN